MNDAIYYFKGSMIFIIRKMLPVKLNYFKKSTILYLTEKSSRQLFNTEP